MGSSSDVSSQRVSVLTRRLKPYQHPGLEAGNFEFLHSTQHPPVTVFTPPVPQNPHFPLSAPADNQSSTDSGNLRRTSSDAVSLQSARCPAGQGPRTLQDRSGKTGPAPAACNLGLPLHSLSLGASPQQQQCPRPE